MRHRSRVNILVITSFRRCHNIFLKWIWWESICHVCLGEPSRVQNIPLLILLWKDPIFNWTVLLCIHLFSIIFSRLKSWGKYCTAREFHKKNFIQSNMEKSKSLPRKIQSWLKLGVMLSCLNQPLNSHVQFKEINYNLILVRKVVFYEKWYLLANVVTGTNF